MTNYSVCVGSPSGAGGGAPLLAPCNGRPTWVETLSPSALRWSREATHNVTVPPLLGFLIERWNMEQTRTRYDVCVRLDARETREFA